MEPLAIIAASVVTLALLWVTAYLTGSLLVFV